MGASPDLSALGRFLRDRRRERGLTQAQLAEALGWTQERISVLENGKYGMSSVSALAALARALECHLIDVLRAAGFAEEDLSSVDGESADASGSRDGHYYVLQRLFG